MTKNKHAPLPKPYNELIKELDDNSAAAFKEQGLHRHIEEADFRAKLRADFERPLDSRVVGVGEHATGNVVEIHPVVEDDVAYNIPVTVERAS